MSLKQIVEAVIYKTMFIGRRASYVLTPVSIDHRHYVLILYKEKGGRVQCQQYSAPCFTTVKPKRPVFVHYLGPKLDSIAYLRLK
jgi:hypothetical protein